LKNINKILRRAINVRSLRKKTLISIITTITMLVFACNTVFATSQTISAMDGATIYSVVPVVQPSGKNWCWAACDEMSGKFYYRYKTTNISSRTQSDVVYFTFGDYNDHTGTAQQAAAGYMYVGYSTPPYNPVFSTAVAGASAFEYSSMKGFVNLNKPTIGGLLLTLNGNPAGGHMVVVDGYDDTGSQIRIINPWTGSYQWVSFSSFKTGFNLSGYIGKLNEGVYVS
jgi:hypothetical protein